jgi:lipopolysaccharide heptosyltransferase III
MKPKRVFIYRHGSLGDTVVALPCFHLIERSFPGAERIVLTNIPLSSKAAPLEVILKEGGFIHGSIELPPRLRDPVALARLALKLRRLDPGVLVYLAQGKSGVATRRDLAYFRLCGFRTIIGAPRTADLQTNRVTEDGRLERESQRLARTLVELGTIDLRDPSWWDLRLTAEERATARAALGALATQPSIAVNTGGKTAEKDWGEPNWAALLDGLAEELAGWGVVFVGSQEDHDRAERLGAGWKTGPVVNLCGRLTPRESGAALDQVGLFIGHDSGPLHLASAMGTPSIGLFGSFNQPEIWHPSGQRTRIIHRTEGLATITPAEVIDLARELLEEADTRRGSP